MHTRRNSPIRIRLQACASCTVRLMGQVGDSASLQCPHSAASLRPAASPRRRESPGRWLEQSVRLELIRLNIFFLKKKMNPSDRRLTLQRAEQRIVPNLGVRVITRVPVPGEQGTGMAYVHTPNPGCCEVLRQPILLQTKRSGRGW